MRIARWRPTPANIPEVSSENRPTKKQRKPGRRSISKYEDDEDDEIKCCQTERFTFAGPDGQNHLVLHAEDHGGQDHGREAGLRYEGAVRHQENQAEEDQSPGVNPSQGSFDSTGAVDRRPGEGPGGRHGLDEAAEEVADSQRHHLLAGVHRLSASYDQPHNRTEGQHTMNTYRKPWL